jgi:hypothetical protein
MEAPGSDQVQSSGVEVSEFRDFNIREHLRTAQNVGWSLCELNVNLRVESGMVNPPIVVQRICGTNTHRLNFRETSVAEKPLSARLFRRVAWLARTNDF